MTVLSVDDKNDLVKDLRSGDDKRREYAVKVLARNMDSEEVAQFLRRLRPQDWEGKISACALFEKLADDLAVEKLKTLVLDFNPRVRQTAARALQKVGIEKPFGDDEVAELVSFLSHPSWWVKTKTIKSLEALRDPRALEPISRLLLDEDESVRQAAEEAVETLGKIA
ncbi:MAG TPA: HEAT repeat domain-containing protein [bacterium]|nr:HEAT repeat domain-containing protein [bacterium]